MRRIPATVVAIGMVASNAFAATAWQGEAVIDTATSACAPAGIVSKTVVKTVLQPKDLTGNTSNTVVTFDFNNLALFALVLDHGAMPSGTGVAFGGTLSGAITANVGILYSQFVQTPASVAFNTPDVTLNGAINDFMFLHNCDVSFRAAYTKNNGS